MQVQQLSSNEGADDMGCIRKRAILFDYLVLVIEVEVK